MADSEVEVPSIEDLIASALGEKPDEFANRFNELMRDRLTNAVNDKKNAMAASMFGANPADVVDALDQTHAEEDAETDDNDETPPEPEEKDDGTTS